MARIFSFPTSKDYLAHVAKNDDFLHRVFAREWRGLKVALDVPDILSILQLMTHFVIVSVMTHQFQHITQIMAGKTWEAKLSDQLAEQLLNFKRADWVDGFVLGIRP